MGAEIAEPAVEHRQLQRVDHAAHGVDDAAGQQPAEGAARQGVDEAFEGDHADPAHGDVDHGGKPFGAGNPYGVDDHAHDGDGPHQAKEQPAGFVAQHQQADGGVGSGDEDEDHHVIHLAQNLIYLR